MPHFFSLKIIFIAVTVFFATASQAKNIIIQVNDGNGQPLKNAIIEIIGSSVILDQASSEPAIMDQVNKRFLPDLLLIKQGQSVSFPNSDNIRHHVYSFSTAKQFELKLYAGKPKSSIKFEKNGVIIVGCNIHDSMIGNIYVAKNVAMITNSDGKVSIDLDPRTGQISIWHPYQKKSPEKRHFFDLSSVLPSDDHYSFDIETTSYVY